MERLGRGNGRLRARWIAPVVLVLPLLLAALLVLPRSVHAATAHVTSCSGNPATPSSLGALIAAATSGDTIVFDQDCTVALTTPLTIPSALTLTIDASGHTVVLDGGGTTQILHLQATANHGPTVTLTGLTLQHGAATQGGAIFNDQGTLTITNAAIITNSATASGSGIENAGGTLKITNSTLAGNLVSGPTGATGGAIDNTAFGKVTLVSTTISGNRVTSPASQSAAGGDIFDFATVAGSLTLTDTLIAGNTGGNCNGADVGSANPNGVTSGGHNLIGVRHSNAADATCGVDFTALAGGGNEQVGSDATPVDAKLGPLGNNGGTTPTVPLLLGSPAIDAGGASCPAGVTTDQRGVARPVNGACDIGAYESGGFTIAKIAVSATGGVTTLKIGETVQLKATGTFNEGSTADVTSQVQWTSANGAVASVDPKGLVTAVTPGTVQITATSGAATPGTVSVTVTPGTLTGVQPAPAPAGRPAGQPGGAAPPAVAPEPAPTPRKGP